MRSLLLSAVLLVALGSASYGADIRVLTPGVIANSGLREVAPAFSAKTGIKVTIVPAGMETILDKLKSASVGADIVMLPMNLMGTAALEKAIVPGSFTPLGRVQIGLFKKAGAARPDISTVQKLAAALKGASTVLYTDPATGSMQAGICDALLKRPEFAGVKGQPVRGNAEGMLKRGTGDASAMALGLVHQAHGPGDIKADSDLVGPLPAELGAYMDMATAVSAKSADVKDAEAFIRFALSPAAAAFWHAKGVDRY